MSDDPKQVPTFWNNVRKAALVFLAYVILDVVWARYTIDLASHAPLAMMWAAVIPLLSGYVVIQYVKEPWLLGPVMLGAVTGTFLGMYGPALVGL